MEICWNCERLHYWIEVYEGHDGARDGYKCELKEEWIEDPDHTTCDEFKD